MLSPFRRARNGLWSSRSAELGDSVRPLVVLLALLAPAAAHAQGAAASGGAGLPDLSAIQKEVGRAIEGEAGRIGKGAVGALGLAASVRYGAYAAFGALSGDSDALASVGVRGDGSLTGEPATEPSTSTSTATSTTTSTQ